MADAVFPVIETNPAVVYGNAAPEDSLQRLQVPYVPSSYPVPVGILKFNVTDCWPLGIFITTEFIVVPLLFFSQIVLFAAPLA